MKLVGHSKRRIVHELIVATGLVVQGLLVALASSECNDESRETCQMEYPSEIRDALVPSRTNRTDLLCFAIVRPMSLGKELTVDRLAAHLATACDAWYLFGSEADPGRNIWRVFSEEDNIVGMGQQMRPQIIDGAWRWLAARGLLDQYKWLVKVDSDTYIRVSTFRKSFSRYPPEFAKVLSLGNCCESLFSARADWQPVDALEDLGGSAIDGPFIAIPQRLVRNIWEIAQTGSRLCDDLASGHNDIDCKIVITLDRCNEWVAAWCAGLESPLEDCRAVDLACGNGNPLPQAALNWLTSVFSADGVSSRMEACHRYESGYLLKEVNWLGDDGEPDSAKFRPGDSFVREVFRKARLGAIIELEPQFDRESDSAECLRRAGGVGVELLTDIAGDSLVAADPTRSECPSTAVDWLLAQSSPYPTSRMCDSQCPMHGHDRIVCLASDFAIVHSVKRLADWVKLAAAFP